LADDLNSTTVTVAESSHLLLAELYTTAVGATMNYTP
jgi:hypothetical protein